MNLQQAAMLGKVLVCMLHTLTTHSYSLPELSGEMDYDENTAWWCDGDIT